MECVLVLLFQKQPSAASVKMNVNANVEYAPIMLTIHNGISKSYQLGLFACLSTVKEEIYFRIFYQQTNYISLLQKHQIMKRKVCENRKIASPN